LVTSGIGTAFQNMLLKETQKEWDDEEEDVSSYWLTVKKQAGTAN